MRRLKKRGILKSAVISYINDNAKAYVIVIIMLFIGLVLGVIFINNTNEAEQNQINGYINNFVNSMNSGNQISNIDLLKTYIKNDFIITLILWFLGSTIIGMPLIFLVILYKGYSIGYAASSLIATLGTGKGIVYILVTMGLPYIIYIPCILSLAVSGIKLYKMISEDRRKDNIKIQMIKHTLFCLLMFIIMIVTSLIAMYILIGLTPILSKMH